jgi:hypothetical protein
MMLKLGRIAVVSTAALTFAAATIPTKAEAADLFIPRGHGPVAYGGAGCCQVRVPPPPPPCCAPPPCCVYGGGYGGGGYGGVGYGGGVRVYSGHSFGRILSLVCEPSDDEAQGRVKASHGSFTPRKTILKYRVTKSDFEPPKITVAALIVTETRHTLAA